MSLLHSILYPPWIKFCYAFMFKRNMALGRNIVRLDGGCLNCSMHRCVLSYAQAVTRANPLIWAYTCNRISWKQCDARARVVLHFGRGFPQTSIVLDEQKSTVSGSEANFPTKANRPTW